MIIINFQSNPTTQSVSVDFFEKIINIGKKYDIWIIHDLAYADIVFDEYKALYSSNTISSYARS